MKRSSSSGALPPCTDRSGRFARRPIETIIVKPIEMPTPALRIEPERVREPQPPREPDPPPGSRAPREQRDALELVGYLLVLRSGHQTAVIALGVGE